jgi:hypothetical protein
MNSEQADRDDHYLAAQIRLDAHRAWRRARPPLRLSVTRDPGTESRPGQGRRNPPWASPPRRACRLTGDSRQHVPAREASARSKSARSHANRRFSSKAVWRLRLPSVRELVRPPRPRERGSGDAGARMPPSKSGPASRPYRLTVTRRKVAGIDVASSLVFCSLNRASNSAWRSALRPSAASKAFMVGA